MWGARGPTIRQLMPLSSPFSTAGILLQQARVELSGRVILPELSLHLVERRIGIIGRNGSGKSTLLRLIAGLVAPVSGEVRVEGQDPAKDRRALLRHLGILFQNPDHQILFPTVEEELAFGLIQMGTDKATALSQVHARLRAEGRADWATTPVANLSQGQRHWLCLLAVMMMKPATILLDEPLAGLDLPTQIRLSRIFASLPQRLITISHDPVSVADCNRVIWLDAGRIRDDGPPDAVLPTFLAAMKTLGQSDADADVPR